MRDRVSLVHRYVQFSEHHLLKRLYLLWCIFWYCCPEWDGRRCMDLFMGSLFCCFGLLAFFNVHNIIFLLLLKSGTVMLRLCSFLFFFGYLGVFCASIWILVLFFLVLGRMSFVFWWGLYWICKSLWIVWMFYQYSSNPWTWEVFLPFSVVFRFVSVF